MPQPPIKTTPEDIHVLTGYLRNQVGWIEVASVKKAIPPQHADNRKLEAMRYLGLIERDLGNIKLSEAGRRFAEAKSDDEESAVVRELIRKVPLYHATLEWMHYNKKEGPTKTDIGAYWHDNHLSELGDAKGAALTDAAIFFLRIAGMANLGQFVAAGTGRDTHIKVDAKALGEYVTGIPPAALEPAVPQPPPVSPEKPGLPAVTLGSGLHINIEIHIAADAEPGTIEEIFRNMRRYILSEPSEDGST